MHARDLLIEAYDRLPALVTGTLQDLSPEQLRWAPVDGANTIGWLVWHLTRVLDHLSESFGEEQLWASGDFAETFGLAPDPANSGFGHDAAEIAEVRPQDTGALLDYFTATHRRAMAWIDPLTAADLDRIVDERWDPAVSLGSRLVSILNDDMQHIGQAAYLRGLLLGERKPAGVQQVS
ncbi:DinB family protein [Nocardia sp. NPDC051052]|uniref:mycothiol transferase n=1 Tax=Nocardia sp. NPDC051052 TaxID=3364322 RepID=UPI00378B082E